MRLGWYAGASTALAGSVVLSAFLQRANFYSAMVYLAQSNFCLLVMVNFTLFLYSSLIYGLIRVCFGTLRAVEVEQLTERAWFAITETCLAMTIFREELGAWFLVMFTALVTGKVWGWIGDGRVEILEQQPPANPRLFHARLSISLTASFLYDVWLLRYTTNTVIQQARPNMMVMFLFEFAVLATCSWRTGVRYLLSVAEQNIIKAQTRKRLLERRLEVRRERETILRRQREREQAAAAAGEPAPEHSETLPNEDDIDEMDIEVPGWAAKGELVLWLDLVTGTCPHPSFLASSPPLITADMIKLGIYVALFFMLLRFYGLPIHMMRDLFMTSRDFLKRLNALLRYRRAIQEMKRYPDATEEDLSRENTCIICREEMHPWNPANNPGAIDRVRPKKLPCGHILHLGCLKSWLERQQVCPTCRTPVTEERARGPQNRAAGLRIQFGGGPQPQGQQPPLPPGGPNNAAAAGGQNAPAPQGGEGGPRIFNFGPIQVGFGAGGEEIRELERQFDLPRGLRNQGATPTPTVPPPAAAVPQPPAPGDNFQSIAGLVQQAEGLVQRELQSLQASQAELQTINLLLAELHILRQRQQQLRDLGAGTQTQPGVPPAVGILPTPTLPYQLPPQYHFPHNAVVPPRISTPFVARHGTASTATAIPAGSPELPEGVSIPPGWTLMPLQRLDGAAPPMPQSTPSPAPGATHGEAANLSQSNSNLGLSQTHIHPSGGSTGDAQSPSNPSSSAPAAEAPRPPATEPTVISPSPLAPNWGGSAQLFRTSPRLDNSSNNETTTPQTDSRDGSTAGDHEPLFPAPRTAPDAPAAQPAGPAEGQAKARAATVEDTNDSDDDEEDSDEDDDE
ncbi:hypothetical protein S7711_09155 [Stachybotrys chartarum IBT 7711]|uniref:RING-type E3 ubiquitin transferase n=1 Tax=Stachybotrys chartarum (strain CBS 109288 / IBT 7711) TaxID=1280523 RepID=A0A084AHP4_STACB|nr:hypothetical protein S7711_09155 [Stachybotrys chartarum IBT 7711]KFA46701.1 hypothetical protein S40293_07782 [Stachybotrys chartarum IBT 40293]